MLRLFLILTTAAVSLSACSTFSTAYGMHDTTLAASSAHYDALAATAQTLGWSSKRGTRSETSLDDWDLQVAPASGQTIIFTQNNFTHQIAFNCKGGALDGKEACIAAANRLFEPSFHGKY